MNKLLRIITVILAGFALSSLLIYRLRLGDGPTPRNNRQVMQSEVKTVEGQIGTVDEDAKTMTLVDGDQEVTFSFDERTAIVEQGRAVQPKAIPRGAAAAVKYSQRGGKNWARKIEVLAAAPSTVPSEY
jgi:hypothetical protein